MHSLTSPSDTVRATLSVSGRDLHLGIERAGRRLVDPSPVGLDAALPHWANEVVHVDRSNGHVSEQFETPAGKRRTHHHEATTATLYCEYDDGSRAELDLQLRDDGLAYRRRVPEAGSVLQADERGGFELPSRATAWLTPYALNHEASIRRTPVAAADGDFCTPGLFEVGDDDWLLVAEAGVDGRYHASRLRSSAGSTHVGYAHPGPGPGDKPVRARGRIETPWRVAIVGDLATVVESDLVPAVVEGPGFDTDWIEPGRVAWSWWSETHSPTDPDRQREYVDYAADRGWEYVLVDEAWNPEWMPDLVDYAAERGVGVFVWAHWTELHEADRRRERLDRWADWGVAGVKIDFMDSDEQGVMQFYEATLSDAAERELLVNFHGSVVPTGLRRRFPNAMTYEGVLGAEHYKWATLTPEHNVSLAFTRNVVGPMDYTPVTFSAESRHTTDAHELALAVVYESGLQHFADGIDAYAARPVAERYLEAVPAAWDETRLLRGRPGSECTIARRRGEEWHVGCLVAGADRTIELSLPMLDGERSGTLIRDGEDGLREEQVTAGPDAPLTVDLDENGGFVLWFSPV